MNEGQDDLVLQVRDQDPTSAQPQHSAILTSMLAAPNLQFQWVDGQLERCFHPMSLTDVEQVITQYPGDPPAEGDDSWAALIRHRDGRWAVIRITDGTFCLVGESARDLVQQVTSIANSDDLDFDLDGFAMVLVDAPGVPSTVVSDWAHSSNDHLRLAAASSSRLDLHSWYYLVTDPSNARTRALANPIADPDTLRRLVSYQRAPLAHLHPAMPDMMAISSNPATPPDVLLQLLTLDNNWIAGRVLNNPNLPEEYRQLAQVGIIHD